MTTSEKSLYFYQAGSFQLVLQSDGSKAFFRGSDAPLAQCASTGASQPTLLLGCDQQGSVGHECEIDGRQTVAYSPYGHEKTLTALVGFTGQLKTRSLAAYLLGNGYRCYNPVLMRFHSPDSLSPFASGGINAYAYCAGDPVNNIDPSGHMFSVNTGNSFSLMDMVPDSFMPLKYVGPINIQPPAKNNYSIAAPTSTPERVPIAQPGTVASPVAQATPGTSQTKAPAENFMSASTTNPINHTRPPQTLRHTNNTPFVTDDEHNDLISWAGKSEIFTPEQRPLALEFIELRRSNTTKAINKNNPKYKFVSTKIRTKVSNLRR